jgi:16S rRNA (uracil1498-N3)-methyltransferase
VFLAAPGTLAGAGPGDVVRLAGEEARHAAAVRRVRPGEELEVVDGAGVRVRGAAESVAPAEVTVRVTTTVVEPPPAVAVVLVQALAKGDRDGLAVEAATELGVDAVQPWQAERCVVVWADSRAERGVRRWSAVAEAAAKQSRRARVPAVRPLLRGRDLVAVARAATARGDAVVVLHEGATVSLRAVPLPAAGEVLLVVGPEGGLTDRELADLTRAGAAVARLGPHVLRTSTAGPVAVALVSERLGRWALPHADR